MTRLFTPSGLLLVSIFCLPLLRWLRIISALLFAQTLATLCVVPCSSGHREAISSNGGARRHRDVLLFSLEKGAGWPLRKLEKGWATSQGLGNNHGRPRVSQAIVRVRVRVRGSLLNLHSEVETRLVYCHFIVLEAK